MDYFEIVEPIGERVLVKKDTDKGKTKGGILLPGNSKIPVVTARVIAISAHVENDPLYRVRQYDKVLIDPSRCIPVDIEDAIMRGDKGANLYIVPLDDIVAVFNRIDEDELCEACRQPLSTE